MDFKEPIEYLERSDFTADGSNLIHPLRRSPIFVMFQSARCGHCTVAKPAFQTLANLELFKCMSIQTDGIRQSERDIEPILGNIYTDFQGYPSYMLFVGGRKVPYIGARDVESMKNFVLGAI
jgi:hypothetical protein